MGFLWTLHYMVIINYVVNHYIVKHSHYIVMMNLTSRLCPFLAALRQAATTQGLSLPYSTSQNYHFTTTKRMLFQKLGPLIKTVHQGYFPP